MWLLSHRRLTHAGIKGEMIAWARNNCNLKKLHSGLQVGRFDFRDRFGTETAFLSSQRGRMTDLAIPVEHARVGVSIEP
jgi:hypothetical protein